ncbi:MAG: hypothetical protein ABSG45_02675 [Nitrososphaerales archaeon]
MQTAPAAKSSKTGRNAGIVVIIVLLLSGVAYYFGAGLTGVPSSVTVSGRVCTNGTGTNPKAVIFTNENGGQAYDTAVFNGQYSASLPNQQSYTVTIEWSGPSGANGTCNAGTFSLGQGAGGSSLTGNWSC